MQEEGLHLRPLLFDTSIIRDIAERRKIDINKLFLEIFNKFGGARHLIYAFEDELQTKLLDELIKLIKPRGILDEFMNSSSRFKLISYDRRKNGFYAQCNELLQAIRKAFGLRMDENCKKEIECDAFLLITACALIHGYKDVIIITSDSTAYNNLSRVINNLNLSNRVMVHLAR